MPQPETTAADPAKRFEEDFKKTFRPDHSRAGRMTPRTLIELDAIADGDVE